MVRKCTVNDQIIKAHHHALSISPLTYPIKSTKLFVFNVDDKSNENTSKLSLGNIIPNKVIVGVLDDENNNGTYKKNPFYFQHQGVKCVNLIINGINNEIKINNVKVDYVKGYHSICESLNFYGSNKSSITKFEYNKGNFLYGFNLNPDKGCPFFITKIKKPSFLTRLEKIQNFKI